jgi:hypothetical protein
MVDAGSFIGIPGISDCEVISHNPSRIISAADAPAGSIMATESKQTSSRFITDSFQRLYQLRNDP